MKKTRILKRLIAVIIAVACVASILTETVGAWKTKTHGYSANLLLDEIKKGYFMIDGSRYDIPSEFLDALNSYPAAFRAGTLGPDFYPDMLTGQSYIHPYDADAGIGVGDWLMELVDAVNALPKDHKKRKEALAFTLGMAIHYAGDMFGHDFINAFAGGAYPAYAEAAQDKNKLFYIIRHMAQETYMDSLIGDRLGSTSVAAPEKFIMNSWIYEGTANNGPANIYSNYDGGMMYQYKYLVEMREKLYKYAEKQRESITPPMPQIVQYLDRWIEDLDNATYQLIVAFDDIAHDFLTGANGKGDVAIVTDRLNKWLDDYGKYASPAPDILTDIAKAFGKGKDWVLKELGLSYISEAWKQFKNELVQDMILWGLAQAGIDYNKYADYLKDPELALEANGGSEADYLEFKSYMDAFASNYERLDAFYNTLMMGRLILMGPDNLNSFFRKYGVTSSFQNGSGHIMMDEFDIEIKTKDGSILTTYGTDDNVFVDVYENGKKICSKLLDKSGYDDFERGDDDTYTVSLPHQISPDKFSLSLRIEKISAVEADPDEWTINGVWVTCKCGGVYIFGKTVTTKLPNGQTITLELPGTIKVLDKEHTFKKWGSKLNMNPGIKSGDLSYTTALNPTIISFMKSNDNSTQWVNSGNILWNNMTARRNILYEVFHGFKPTIALSVSKTSFYQGESAQLKAEFTSYWNGITKARRDKEYIVSSVGETKQQACTGTVRIININNGGAQVLTGTVNNGKMTVSLNSLEPGNYRLRAEYDGDAYNGSANSNVVNIQVLAPRYTVTYKVANGFWSDGTNGAKTETVSRGGHPAYVPTGMRPAYGFEGGRWNADPYNATIAGNTTFVYQFDEMPRYTVTYRIVNGTWSDGSTGDKTETLYRGEHPAAVPAGMIARPGCGNGSWDADPSSVSVGGDRTFTYTFSELPKYTVTYRVENGTWSDGSATELTETVISGDSPASVPSGMKPADGFGGGRWDEDPSSATIDGERTFTYTFDPLPTYTVTYKVVNGMWADGSATELTEEVMSGKSPAAVPTGMKATEGFAGGSWNADPAAAKITGDTTFTYTFEELKKYVVTFEVENGAWGDGTREQKTVTLTGLDDTMYLSADQIPAVGSDPDDTFKAGSWNNTPTETTEITGDVKFTYTYAKEDTITRTVTFKVVNGAWNNGSKSKITVKLTGYEGDVLTLDESQIPAVGANPNSTYKAGSWNVEPKAGVEITGNPTYTYTYAKKDAISQTVTFKVVNGAWDDGSTDDITVVLNGYENDVLKLDEAQIPAVGGKPDETYKPGKWDTDPEANAGITDDPTYTYTYAKKDAISQTVTFKVENGAWDDGTTDDITVTLTGYEGDVLKLDGAQIPTAGKNPADTYKAGKWDTAPKANTAINGDPTYIYTYAKKDAISRTVTFRVEDGAWNDGTTEDKTVTLTGYEGDVLTLGEKDIPAVGGKPDETYKPGAWDTEPEAGAAVTTDPVYTYTYVKKDTVNLTVTFKVVNGAWDDGSTNDMTATLTGLEGDVLKLDHAQIPAVGNRPDATYRSGAWDYAPETDAGITDDFTFTYTYVLKDQFVVTYETNGGTRTASETVYSKDPVTVPADPEKRSFAFTGWFADEACETEFDFRAGVEADTVVYAGWEQVTYEAEGDVSYTDGSDDEVVITVRRSHDEDSCFDHFTGVTADGVSLIEGTDYTAVAGSTVVTLKNSLLQELGEGVHNVTVVFDDGRAELSLTVNSAPSTPQTGEPDHFVILFAMVAAGAALVALCGKRRRTV